MTVGSFLTNPGNYQKTPIGGSLNRLARQNVGTAIQQLGKALPCSVVSIKGQAVKVKFEIASKYTLPQIVIPIATSKYDWLPLQAGDVGVTQPADAYLGGISGLGGGIADLTPPANLEALVFVPCAQASWSVPDTNQRVVQGPTGVLLRDTGNNCSINLTSTGVTITVGGNVIATIDATGVHSETVTLHTHKHPTAALGSPSSPTPGT
jgi:hypothetical protein